MMYVENAKASQLWQVTRLSLGELAALLTQHYRPFYFDSTNTAKQKKVTNVMFSAAAITGRPSRSSTRTNIMALRDILSLVADVLTIGLVFIQLTYVLPDAITTGLDLIDRLAMRRTK